ncbi:hypothetical protein R3P38DRAFT_2940490 [Favolaschia claudopus]|uniref:Transmembrane protein n=1 Tax=Favolaschia claudopus TaxID=2862362 RepID=A0AAW0BMZ9_9AGAR
MEQYKLAGWSPCVYFPLAADLQARFFFLSQRVMRLSNRTRILGLVSFFALFSADAMAQIPTTTQLVTLWQFGQGRLLAGQATLPLQPLSTARDGSATAYLFQALNPVTITTVVDGAFTTQTTPSATPRTVIASASGWIEPFGDDDIISCGLSDATFGGCVEIISQTNIKPQNSGVPTPQVFRVAGATVSTSGEYFPSFGLTPSPTLTPQSATPAAAKRSSSGAVIGGVVAGLLVFAAILALCIFLLRRRWRRQDETAARGFEAPVTAAPTSNDAPDMRSSKQQPLSFASFEAGPQLELGQSKQELMAYHAPSNSASSHPVTLSVRNGESQEPGDEDAPPPAYSGRSMVR